MAPLNYHQYKGRAVNVTVVSTAVIITFASLFVLVAFGWGFALPWLRKKYFPPKPSQTKYNQPSRRFHGNESSVPLIQNPSRIRERHENAERRSTPLTVYNPRFQTPFPRPPPQTEPYALPTHAHPRWYSQNLSVDHQVYTPIQDRQSSFPITRLPAPHTLPRVRSRSHLARPSVHDKDFGDAKEYILAVPEPLRVRSRTQEDQLVASDTLASLPNSIMSPTSTDKHFHPNKLFAQLNGKDAQGNDCTDASVEINNKVDDEQNNHQSGLSQQSEAWPRMSQLAAEPEEMQYESDYHYSASASEAAPPAYGDDDDSAEHNASVTAMHRLGAYRSLVGALPPEPLTRAGTLTRPKTPVAKMRGIYDKTANGRKATVRPVSQDGSIMEFLHIIGGNTGLQTGPSSTNSQTEAPTDQFSASSLSLLPTPLRINHPVDCMPASVPAKRSSRFTEDLDNNGSTSLPHKKVARTDKGEGDAVTNSSPLAQSTNVRTRPRARPLAPPLNESVRQLRQPTTPSHGRSPHAGRAMHIRRPPISSFDPSSIYSRDTRGFSIANTLATSEFPETPKLDAPFSPRLPSTNNEADIVDKDDEPMANADSSEEEDLIIHSSPDSDKPWELDTREIVINTSPSSSLKRALSNLGPDCESSHEVSSDEEEPNRHSVISTEMTPSEMRLSRVTGAVRISDCTSVATPRNSHDAVREGGDWF